MAKSTTDTAWQQKRELYEKLVATRPDVARKGACLTPLSTVICSAI